MEYEYNMSQYKKGHFSLNQPPPNRFLPDIAKYIVNSTYDLIYIYN